MNIIFKFTLSIAFALFICVGSIYAQDLHERKKKTIKKVDKQIKKVDKQIVIKGKLNNKSNGKSLADLPADQRAKKQAMNRPVAKKAVSPSKTITSKANKTKKFAKIKGNAQARKANFKKGSYDIDGSKFRQKLNKKSN